MNEEQNVAYINAMVACAMIEALGMTAENQQRMREGNSLAFVYDPFCELIEKYGIHHNNVLTILSGK